MCLDGGKVPILHAELSFLAVVLLVRGDHCVGDWLSKQFQQFSSYITAVSNIDDDLYN